MAFNAVKVKNDCVQAIKDWFEANGKDCTAVVAISGGADSAIVAALCVEALGKKRVFGVLMPDGEQNIEDAFRLADYLDIRFTIENIHEAVLNEERMIRHATGRPLTEQARINIPPRIRMTTARGIAQNMNGRYINTSNLSEDYVGYFTIDGDGTGDFSPLKDLTKTEAVMIGELLLPNDIVHKTPHADLTDKSDEEDFGFTYTVLDRYIRTGEIDDADAKAKIDARHNQNLFKLRPMARFEYKGD